MSNDKMLYNFDFGTVQVNENDVRIKISKEQFQIQNKNASNFEYLPTDDNDSFLDKEKIVEEDNNYVFIYDKSSLSLKSLIEIKDEEYPVKVSIAEEILEKDILNEYIYEDIYISLNPATMFYYPMQKVKYTYAGNPYMPRTEHSVLLRYKACVASILSGIPYEKCLNTPEDVQRESNDFIKEIYEKNSRAELLQLVRDTKSYTTYNYISNRTEEKKKAKRVLFLSIGTMLFLGVASVMFTFSVSSSSHMETAEQYETQLEEKDRQIEAEQAMQAGEYEQAIQLFEEAGVEASTVADKLITEEQYQLAINTDNSKLEGIIQTLYENNEQEQISELNSEVLNEETTNKLENEQAIVAGDENTMLNVLNFLNDENTAERLASKFVEQGNMSDVEQIQQQYPENTTINNVIESGNRAQELQSQIDDLNQQIEDTDDEDEQNNLQSQIDDLQEELDNL